MSSSGVASQRRLALIAVAAFVAGGAQAARIIGGEGGDLAIVATVCFLLVFVVSGWQYLQTSRPTRIW